MHIFLISGKARSGKDTVADFMANKLPGKTVKIAMADYLKYIAAKYYDWNGEKDEAGRSLIQFLGTDRIRNELGWDTFHVERACQDIKIIEDTVDYVIIPDARFKNEIYYTKAKFPDQTTTVRVERPGFNSPLTRAQQNHKSERDLDMFPFDHVIINEYGIEELECLAEEVLDSYYKLTLKKYTEQH